MNEFIVWDSEYNKFISWEDVAFTKDKNDDFIIIMKEIDETTSEGRNFQTFNYIGLKDINNKKIYADSSIIEFREDKDLGYGYFTYDFIKLRYIIKVISSNEIYNNLELPYESSIMKNIKIIDTIQENKLGLIK